MDLPSHEAELTQGFRADSVVGTPGVLLSQIRAGQDDRLGNKIKKIHWIGLDYIIYCTHEGVFVHFSDCPEREAVQRSKLTEIVPELCELRYLTGEIRIRGTETIFDHNIAQAIMLLMENKPGDAKKIASEALRMAVKRVTNDNTITYMKASLIAAVWISVPIVVLGLSSYWLDPRMQLWRYAVAAAFGVWGAAFSIVTRVRSFEVKPCQQSDMNSWMSRFRIGSGCIGGLLLLVLLDGPFGQSLISKSALGVLDTWQAAASIGFLGGFAERLIQTLLGRASGSLDDASGTAVLKMRGSLTEATA
jgi:hypothetical protein